MAWHDDDNETTYVASYKNEKEATADANKAARNGWMLQASSATKGRVFITYVRTPAWVAQREQRLEEQRSERNKTIIELEQRIAAKEQELTAARGAYDVAAEREAAVRKELHGIEYKVRQIDSEVHRKNPGVYLNGGSLDRGSLSLGNERIVFTGWRGKVDIPLKALKKLDLGVSNLPSRAGFPVLGKLSPGRPRERGALLLTVQREEERPMLSVIGDLTDVAAWRDEIVAQQGRLGDIAERRTGLLSLRAKSKDALALANEQLRTAQANRDAIAGSVMALLYELRKWKPG